MQYLFRECLRAVGKKSLHKFNYQEQKLKHVLSEGRLNWHSGPVHCAPFPTDFLAQVSSTSVLESRGCKHHCKRQALFRAFTDFSTNWRSETDICCSLCNINEVLILNKKETFYLLRDRPLNLFHEGCLSFISP